MAFAAPAVAPLAAHAASTISVPGKCYVYWPDQGSQTIPISMSGLTPGQQVKVELQVDGTTVSGLPSLVVDGTGSIVTELKNWVSGLGDGPSKATPSKIVVSDFVLGTPIASTDLNIANVGLDVDAARKVYGTKRRWEISGLNRLGGGNAYWAYYFKGGKQVGKQKIGGAKDECGYLRTQQLLIPFRKTGTYDMKVQASATYSSSLPWIGGTVHQGMKK